MSKNRDEHIEAFETNVKNFLPIEQESIENGHRVIRATSQNLTDEVSVITKRIKSNLILSRERAQFYPDYDPRKLVPEKKRLFTDTDGGISIKHKVKKYHAQDIIGKDIELPPIEKKMAKSPCLPTYMRCYNENFVGSIFRINLPDIEKLCLLNPGNELRIRIDSKMVEGIYNEEEGRFYKNNKEIVIPIIDDSKYEKNLMNIFKDVLLSYPNSSAILVRNNGIYVWGNDWKSAKTQCEFYAYVINNMLLKKINKL